MLVFPESCMKNVILSKDRFTSNADLFRDQISRIRLKYVIDDKTSNYVLSDPSDAVVVISVSLKKRIVPVECLQCIADDIPRNVIFELEHDGASCYAFVHDEVFYTEFGNFVDFDIFCLNAVDLYDEIRLRIIGVKGDFSTVIEGLLQEIEIRKKIMVLSEKIKKERQPNRQLELKVKLNQLNSKLEEIVN